MVTAPAGADVAGSIARAGRDSPLREGGPFSAAADSDEFSFREEIEPYQDPVRDVPRFIDSKRLPEQLELVLERTGIAPGGVVVEFGAGVCWLAASLAKRAEVSRVVAIEFSRRRLDQLAPIAIAHLGAPPEKIERVVADFHAPGLPTGAADLVVCDAAFHHATDPRRLALVAYEALRPGGTFLMIREPTITRLRRGRDHGLEGRHGDFEHEYARGEYLALLRTAGFHARSSPAPGDLGTRRGRAVLRPPFSWFNGLAYSEYAYVGHKPERAVR